MRFPEGQSLETFVHVPVIIFLSRDKDTHGCDSHRAIAPTPISFRDAASILGGAECSRSIVDRGTVPHRDILCLDTKSISQMQTPRGVNHTETTGTLGYRYTVICGIVGSVIGLIIASLWVFLLFFFFTQI